MMRKTAKNHWRLFRSTFSLSAFTFGGGYVIVPLMRKKFVEQLAWLDDEEMLNMVAIGQSAPGAIAINTSILVGWRLLGFSGALVSLLGTMLPPFLILSAVTYVYTAIRDSALVAAILQGMMAAVSAVVLDAVFSMGVTVTKTRSRFLILVMGVSFAAQFALGIGVVTVILFFVVVGVFYGLWKNKNTPAKADGGTDTKEGGDR